MEENKRERVSASEDNYTHNISRSNERKIDRRSFMKTMVGAAGVFAVSTLPWGAMAAKELMGFGGKSYPKVKVAELANVPVNGSVEFHYPSAHESAMLIRLGENEWKAYQNACTHLKCPVLWDGGDRRLVCPCHHGFFDVDTGKPTAGPPQRPLPEIELSFEDGGVYATGVKRYEA